MRRLGVRCQRQRALGTLMTSREDKEHLWQAKEIHSFVQIGRRVIQQLLLLLWEQLLKRCVIIFLHPEVNFNK